MRRTVVERGDILAQLRNAVNVRIVDFARHQLGKLAGIAVQQLLQPHRMDAALRQIDVHLLFPDGLCVFEVEIGELHVKSQPALLPDDSPVQRKNSVGSILRLCIHRMSRRIACDRREGIARIQREPHYFRGSSFQWLVSRCAVVHIIFRSPTIGERMLRSGPGLS